MGIVISELGVVKISEYLGDNGKGYVFNVIDFELIEVIFVVIKVDLGDIDVLVNNVGIICDNLLMCMKDGEWDDIIDINLSLIFCLLKVVLCFMMKKKNGCIINIGFVVGIMGNVG